MRNPRIIYLATARMPGERAHSIQIIKTCEALTKTGADVTLIVPRRKGAKKEDIVSFYGLRVKPKIIKVPAIDILRRAVDKGKAYMLLTLTFYALALPMILTLRLRGKPVIYVREKSLLILAWITKPLHLSPIIYEMHELPMFRGAMGRLQKVALHICEKIVTISAFQKKSLEKMGFHEDGLAVIPDAADERTIRELGDKEELREKLQLPKDKIIVTYSGQLSEWKRPEFILQAAQYLKNENVVFLFLGGARKDLERLREHAERLNISDRVILKGYVKPPEVASYLKASDMLVHYSASTGGMASLSPLKIFEYMLSGKPLLAPDYPYIKEIIQDRVNGFLYKHDDSRSLAELIEKIAEMSEEEMRSITARAQSTARREYTYEARAKKILEVVSRI